MRNHRILVQRYYCQLYQYFNKIIHQIYIISCFFLEQTQSKAKMKKSHLLLVLLLIIFGAANTIFLTLQNHQKIPELVENNKFKHPFMQTAVMFLGQFLCFIPYLIYRKVKSKKDFLERSGFMKQQCPVYLPFIPGIMDLLSSLLAYISLGLIAGSVWQISRGGVIITTAIFSKIFLSKKFTKSSILGCVLAFVGITLVQIFQITLSDKSDKKDTDHTTTQQIIGVVLLLVSLVFNTAALIIEKILFNKYSIHPLKMVYLEGLFGFVGISIIIFILNFVTCPESFQQKCIFYEGKYYFQNVQVFYDQISQNLTLFLYIVGLLFSIGISVPLAVTISKVINPVSRSLADVCRTVIIWSFCILLTFTIGEDNDEYALEEKGLLLNLLKLIGFIFVVLGTMIYHDIIRVFKQDDRKDSSLLTEQTGTLDIDNDSILSQKKTNSQPLIKTRQSLM